MVYARGAKYLTVLLGVCVRLVVRACGMPGRTCGMACIRRACVRQPGAPRFLPAYRTLPHAARRERYLPYVAQYRPTGGSYRTIKSRRKTYRTARTHVRTVRYLYGGKRIVPYARRRTRIVPYVV